VESTVQSLRDLLRRVTENGQTVIFGVLIAALVCATVLGALHDISSDAVVAIYSTLIGGGIGHLSGKALAKRDAEIERLKAAPLDAGKGRKR
jgi:predicted membrane protein